MDLGPGHPGKIDALDRQVGRADQPAADARGRDRADQAQRRRRDLRARSGRTPSSARSASQNQGPIKNEALRAIYREIMSAAIALEKPLLVAYLGPEATQHPRGGDEEIRGQRRLPRHGDDRATSSPRWRRARPTLAVIPIENSTEGSVRETLDSFVESDLKIVGQIYLEITHALISRVAPREDHAGLFQGPGPGPVPALAAAPSAPRPAGRRPQHLPRGPDRQGGSDGRGGRRRNWPAEYYGVPVVGPQHPGQGRQHHPFLRPRAQARRLRSGSGKDMTSLLISLGDEAASHSGALLKMLMPLAERGINLSKIESRPSKKRPVGLLLLPRRHRPLRRPADGRRRGGTAEVLPDGEVAGQLSRHQSDQRGRGGPGGLARASPHRQPRPPLPAGIEPRSGRLGCRPPRAPVERPGAAAAAERDAGQTFPDLAGCFGPWTRRVWPGPSCSAGIGKSRRRAGSTTVLRPSACASIPTGCRPSPPCIRRPEVRPWRRR